MMTMRAAAALCMACVCAGCAINAQDKSHELSRVAKDWALIIRASQVIPVYPLTEDLRPGDVFVSTTPIGREIALYESAGYLPLDQHFTRLQITGMDDMYRSDAQPSGPGWKPSMETWPAMPLAGFPIYNFTIQKDGGVNLALPVKGVPVGLSLLGTSVATGTITLDDARTYGTDMITIDRAVHAFRDGDSRVSLRLAELGRQAIQSGGPAYLRVVTRVFLVGGVSVQLTDQAARGANFSAGGMRPIELPEWNVRSDGDAAEHYRAAFENLERGLLPTPGVIGGSLKLVAVSARGVSIDQRFTRPLVVGYHAIDYLILPDGSLGAGIPTIERVDPEPRGGVLGAGTSWTPYLREELRKNANRLALQSWLERNGYPNLSLSEFIRDAAYQRQHEEFVRYLMDTQQRSMSHATEEEEKDFQEGVEGTSNH